MFYGSSATSRKGAARSSPPGSASALFNASGISCSRPGQGVHNPPRGGQTRRGLFYGYGLLFPDTVGKPGTGPGPEGGRQIHVETP